ncbi:MAG: FimB/Mfa2 family fimbrial subunit [Bacteroidales bacterium]|nr:FimB/Mfa2 family fimbrial subunit [Bacteroidales bacterium]
MGKNYLCIAALAVVCASACEKNVSEAVQADMPAVLNISLPEAMTKVTDTSGEDRVEDMQVFVFKKDGSLDAYGKAAGGHLSMSCTVGERDIVALVNAPSYTDVKDYATLLGRFSDLKDNAPGRFVMSGQTACNVSSSTSVEVDVRRLVARISIASVKNEFTLPQYRDADFRITGIYLVNVAGDRMYLSGDSDGIWYNKMKNDSSSDVSGLVYSGNLDVPLMAGSSYSVTHYFYCYPNAVLSDSSDPEWSARQTRLVVETSLDGKTYYYPVNIEGIASNHTYEISEMKITRIGSDSPDIPVSSDAVGFTVNVKDWVAGGSMEVEI